MSEQVCGLCEDPVDADELRLHVNRTHRMMPDRYFALVGGFAASGRQLAAAESALSEMRAALYFEVKTAPGINLENPATCRGCGFPKGGWPNPQDWETEHKDGCWVADILATDPQIRGRQLLEAARAVADVVHMPNEWEDTPRFDVTLQEALTRIVRLREALGQGERG